MRNNRIDQLIKGVVIAAYVFALVMWLIDFYCIYKKIPH